MKLRTAIVVLAAGALVGVTLPGTATATTSDTAEVHLVVETHLTARAGYDAGQAPDAVPGTGECTVEVAEGADGGDVLDAAVDEGCIAGWDYDEFGGDRFVTSIDRLRAPGLSCLAYSAGLCDWWEYHVNGETASYGIDEYSAEDGDTNRWLYRNTIGDDTRP